MGGLGSLLLFAVIFFIMMRYGCGAHMMHGHDKHSKPTNNNKPEKYIDPVCNMEIKDDEGYGKMHEGELYRFCSQRCLSKFDETPERYLNKKDGERHVM